MDAAQREGPAPDTSLPTWRVVLAYARPHRRALVVGGLLSLAAGASGLALPLATRQLVTFMAEDRPIRSVLLLLTALTLASACIGTLSSYVLERTAESIVLDARQRLVARLLRLRISAVDRAEPGDLMSRVTSDTTLLREVTGRSLVAAVTGSLTLAATMVLMGLMDVVMLGVTLGVLVLSISVIRFLVPRISRASKQAQDAVGLMGAALERVLGSLRTVKASGAEDREELRVQLAAVEAWRGGVHAAKWRALAASTSGLSMQITFVTILGVGGARVASGAVDLATLIAFLLFIYYLMSPITQLVRAVGDYQVGAAAVTRIREAEELPTEPPAAQAAPPNASVLPAAVAFDNVHFRYRPDLREVHHGVSFVVPPRGMTAFVGPSGAGKTTLFSLIERFYDVTAGQVLLDGVDVRDWPISRLRADIGYVEQDAPVLSGTLRENLLFGAPDASEDDMREVLRTTRLDALMALLPHGLDTTVGHRGTKLSGGERQRVAIARALLRKPRLLLLDEVTSQLDAVNEAALRDSVTNAAATTTVLVVAHRLSTVTTADRIVVMEAGRIRAIGTHTELIATVPLYAELAASQFLATAL